MGRWVQIAAMLVGCDDATQPGTKDVASDDATDATQIGTEDLTPYSTPSPGGVAIVSGFAGTEIALVSGRGERCGEDPPLLLSDFDGDGVPEVGLACRKPGSARDALFYVLDGVALLAGTYGEVGAHELRTDGVSALGDLDGDELSEIGAGVRVQTPLGSGPIDWWQVRTGSSLLGAGVDVAIWGDGQSYGSGAPRPLDDIDGDDVPDLAVWQTPGSADPVISIVSGAAAMAGDVSVLTGAWRRIEGLGRAETIDDIATLGPGEVVVVIGDQSGQYDYDQISVAVVVRGDDLTDPATTTRISGTSSGRDRFGQVEVLGDLDGDGLAEIAVALTTFSSSEENHGDIAVIPGAALQAPGEIDPTPFLLGVVDGAQPCWLEACDLDGDGIPELIVGAEGGIWDGRDLLVPGSLPVGEPLERATCAGDLDGQPGDELLVGMPWFTP